MFTTHTNALRSRTRLAYTRTRHTSHLRLTRSRTKPSRPPTSISILENQTKLRTRPTRRKNSGKPQIHHKRIKMAKRHVYTPPLMRHTRRHIPAVRFRTIRNIYDLSAIPRRIRRRSKTAIYQPTSATIPRLQPARHRIRQRENARISATMHQHRTTRTLLRHR